MGKIEPNQSPRPVSLLLWTPVPASPSASFLNTSVPLSFSKAQSGKQRVFPRRECPSGSAGREGSANDQRRKTELWDRDSNMGKWQHCQLHELPCEGSRPFSV